MQAIRLPFSYSWVNFFINKFKKSLPAKNNIYDFPSFKQQAPVGKSISQKLNNYARLFRQENDYFTLLHQLQNCQQIYNDAKKYGIRLDSNNVIDWRGLAADIKLWKQLLRKARALGINWHENNYHPAILQQLIDACFKG